MKTRPIVLVVLLAAVVIALLTLPIDQAYRRVLEWTATHRESAWILFIGLYALATVCFLPGLPLTLAAGAIFGVATGTALVSIGSTLGATGAFFVGRYVARDWIGHKLDAWPRFRALDRAVEHHGFWIVLLTRLSPLFPFFIVNYAFGLTAVKPGPYVLGSWIGMFPATLAYVYAGSLAGSLTRALSGETTIGATGWALLALGLVATFAAAFLVARTAQRFLEREIAASESGRSL